MYYYLLPPNSAKSSIFDDDDNDEVSENPRWTQIQRERELTLGGYTVIEVGQHSIRKGIVAVEASQELY